MHIYGSPICLFILTANMHVLVGTDKHVRTIVRTCSYNIAAIKNIFMVYYKLIIDERRFKEDQIYTTCINSNF